MTTIAMSKYQWTTQYTTWFMMHTHDERGLEHFHIFLQTNIHILTINLHQYLHFVCEIDVNANWLWKKTKMSH